MMMLCLYYHYLDKAIKEILVGSVNKLDLVLKVERITVQGRIAGLALVEEKIKKPSGVFGGGANTRPSGGFGGGENKKPSGVFGGGDNTRPSGGFGGGENKKPSGVFGGGDNTRPSAGFGGGENKKPSG